LNELTGCLNVREHETEESIIERQGRRLQGEKKRRDHTPKGGGRNKGVLNFQEGKGYC